MVRKGFRQKTAQSRKFCKIRRKKRIKKTAQGRKNTEKQRKN